jgi:RNA polymerase sigma-54 factor
MRFGFELKPELRHALTPQMIQLLKLLQLPRLELEQMIRTELEANPLMEIAEPEYEEDQTEKPESEEEELNWEEYYFQDDVDPYYRPMRVDEEHLTPIPARPPSLRDTLLMQLRIHTNDSLVLKIGEYIIDSLDENGFLSTPLEQITEKLEEDLKREEGKEFRIDPDTAKSTLELIQTFEPSGIGARDLRECLLLQIRDSFGEDSLEYQIVEKHLVDLEKMNYVQIARSLGVSEKQVIKARELIGSLEPKPGRAYSSSDAGYITPDIIIDEKDGELVCMLNESDFPHLRIARAYKDIVQNPGSFSKKERAFIREKMNKAKFLISGLEKRRGTILRIANFVKDYQREFLEKGIKYLKPMNMRMIAQEVQVHEATVSRAVRGKYLRTPRGVFQFKYFFSRGVEHDGSDSCTTVIMQRIKELVEEEDRSKPFSDKELTKLLHKEGYNVKRRTIAKYRTQLNILPARLRRTP